MQPWTPVPGGAWQALRRCIEPYVGASFMIPGDPVPKERRIGQGRYARTPKRTRDAEARVEQALKDALPGWEAEPDGTYGVLVEFRTSAGGRADVDNGTKLLLDALNTVFWQDDIQVGDLFCHLTRGQDEPGTEVWLFASEPNGTPPTRLCECGRRFRTVGKDIVCRDCLKKRAIVNKLLAPDLNAAAEEADRLERERRAVYSVIAANAIGRNTSPSIQTITDHINNTYPWKITSHRVSAVVATLVNDKVLEQRATTPRLKILKPLGAA